MTKVEGQLVSWLKKSRGSSTVADMITGTGLPKYQVEQAARRVLDEYDGRLKATESGELLYSFPSGMHSTVHGAGPSLRRFWSAFSRGALRVLSLAFKIWIVAMLVGYFAAFVTIIVLAIVASFAASMANRSDGRGGGGGGRGRGGGFGGMYLVIRLFEMILRMWFWSNLLKDSRQQKKRQDGRAFYKSVFGFVFGDGDPNADWDENERKHVLAYIVSHKGVITVEELMAMTGREPDDAGSLMNRILLEYEGEPGVTEDGTVVYSFPELMRTGHQDARSEVPLPPPSSKRLVPFSANKRRTNGWILFFNAFNLAFGSWFLGVSVTQGNDALLKTGPYIYYNLGKLLQGIGINNPVPFIAIVLGVIPVAFSLVFFLVPFLRSLRVRRRNAAIREETLRRRILARILAQPAHVDAGEIQGTGSALDPKNLPVAASRMLDRLAAALRAEPVAKEAQGQFAYRFAEIERQAADLDRFRAKIDLKRYELGETVFDSGK
jgi:hypothetical protein